MAKLRDFIRNSGIRQSVLAAELGISRSYMSELVSGEKAPSRELAVKIDRATFGAVTVLSWDHPPSPVPDTPANQGPAPAPRSKRAGGQQ